MQLFMRLCACLLLVAGCLLSKAHAKQIDVVVGWSKPPYVVSDTNSGFELELTRTLLSELGHDMVAIYVPFGRTARLLSSHSADMGLTLNIHHNIDRSLLTDVYVVYQNVAISLVSRKLPIEQINDLSNYTVIGFQTARQVLGEAFAAAVNSSVGYMENPEQFRQVSMLLLGSVDVVVMDRNIFTYLSRKLPLEQQKPVDIHELFGVSPYRAAILDGTLRRQFNEHLAAMIKDGRYQQLLDKYHLVNLLDRLPSRSLTAQ